jgi:esterase/lipase
MFNYSVSIVFVALVVMTMIFYYHQRLMTKGSKATVEPFAAKTANNLESIINEQVKKNIDKVKPELESITRKEIDRFTECNTTAFNNLAKSIDNVSKAIEKIEKAMNKG